MASFSEIAKDPKKLESYSKRLFDAYDKNKSKTFEIDELMSLINKIGKEYNIQEVPTKEDIERLFNKLDLDKSGQLDEKEFQRFTKMILLEIDNDNHQPEGPLPVVQEGRICGGLRRGGRRAAGGQAGRSRLCRARPLQQGVLFP